MIFNTANVLQKRLTNILRAGRRSEKTLSTQVDAAAKKFMAHEEELKKVEDVIDVVELALVKLQQ